MPQQEASPNFDALEASGYTIREIFYRRRFDGFMATKEVCGKNIEVYVGSDSGILFFTPQAYIDGAHVGEAETPEKAARLAENLAKSST